MWGVVELCRNDLLIQANDKNMIKCREQAPAGSRDIPGLNSNPDPGILENIIPGFLGIYHIKQNHDFKDFYWFLNLIFPKNPGIKI